MATDNEIVAIAMACGEGARHLKAADVIITQIINRNAPESITWDASKDAILQAAGIEYTGPEVSNILGSFVQFQNLLNNQEVSQGDHRSNVEKLTTPIV